MNRRSFFKRLGLITAATAIVPEIIAKESVIKSNSISHVDEDGFITEYVEVNGKQYWYIKKIALDEEKFRMDMENHFISTHRPRTTYPYIR